MLKPKPKLPSWSLILLPWLAFLSVLHADPKHEPVCDPQDPESCVQLLLEGEKAPFTGQLLTPRRAAKAAVGLMMCDDRIKLQVAKADELWTVKLDLAKRLAAADLEAARSQIKVLQKALQDSKPPWYQHPAFVSGLTTTILVAILIGSIKVYQALEK